MRNSHLSTTMFFTLLLYLVYLPAFAGGNKVDICHLPPGNPDNWHTIRINENAWPAHEAHGDYSESCLENCETLCSDGDVCTQDVEANPTECLCLSEPTAVNCDDTNECTVDSCNSENDEGCVNAPVADGTECDGGSGVCSSGVCEEQSQNKIVFVTSDRYTGNFGGVSGADTICNDLAGSQSLRGTYKAWLSDGNTEPASSFTQSQLPYVRVDGQQIAANWEGLTSGSLTNEINVDESGQEVRTSPGLVWTNTTTTGNQRQSDCNFWTNDYNESGKTGDMDATDDWWTEAYTDGCGQAHHLYCFEQ